MANVRGLVVSLCWLVSCVQFGSGCAGSRAARVPRKVTAIGVATGIKDVSLARSAAQNRARKNLAMLIQPGAIRFGFKMSGQDSWLTIRLEQVQSGLVSTEFGKLKAGWISYATTTRTDEVVTALENLESTTAEVSVRFPDPSVSLRQAESRALRAVILATLPPGEKDNVDLKGRISLLSLKEELTDDGATVKLEAHVEIENQQALDPGLKPGVHAATVAEHRELREWAEAIAAQKRLINLFPSKASLHADLGQLQLEASQPKEAVDSLSKAVDLEPENLEFLGLELQAARAVPDEVLTAEIEKRIDELQKKD
jgi:tetratricopeptide (TPR) repeat protein